MSETAKRIELAVDGMSCEHCAKSVSQALQTVNGVTSAEVDLEAGRATVQAEDNLEPARLIAAIGEAGYEARAG